MRLLGGRECVRKPIQTLIKTVSTCSARALNVPLPVAQRVQSQFIRNLSHAHGIGQILFVAENKKNSIPKLILVEHLLKLLICLVDAFAIVRIYHEDQSLGILEVVTPQGTDLILTTNIPHCKVDVFVLNCLYVETNCGNGGNDLTKLKFVQNGGFSSSIKSHHQNTHVLLAKEPSEQLHNNHGGIFWEIVLQALWQEGHAYFDGGS